MSCYGQVAQSVEQGIENPRVGGSIPSLATIIYSHDLYLCHLGHKMSPGPLYA